MSESVPPPAPPAKVSSRRPLYLVIALLLVWMVGLFGATEGCQTIDILRRPEAVRVAMNRVSDLPTSKRHDAFIDTVLAFRNLVTPLAVGQLLLGSLLTFSAGLTLLGRGQARKLALQAIVAYSVFLLFDYVTRRPMRAAAIDAMAEVSTFPPIEGGGPSPEMDELRVGHWWAHRVGLAGQLVILSLGLIAMTRPRVRAFFSAMAAESAREQEP